MALLFSYGTLQQQNVQLSTFGRLVPGQQDALVGCECHLVKIQDPQVVATSSKTHHPSVRFSGRPDGRVDGAVVEVTDAELAHAERYEVADYKRVTAQLASGRDAWAYVDARFAKT